MTSTPFSDNNLTLQQHPWWVQRWLELLDSYRFKKRLERARIYAREGNVLSIEFEGPQVSAKVQGSESEPYQVSLRLNVFSDEDWQFIIKTMSQKAIFSAQLLAGEMPDSIEEVFTGNGLNLFPFNLSEVRASCSCPDKANPCKHIGAIYYQLADRFSEDPFVIFQLRGRSKNQILEAIRQLRREKTTQKLAEISKVEQSVETAKQAESKVDADVINLAAFWQYSEPLDPSLVVITPPTDNKTVLDVLGRIPLAYEEAQIVRQYLQQIYQTIQMSFLQEI